MMPEAAPSEDDVMTTTEAAPRPSLWRNRPFRTFWAGETVSQFGDRITELALRSSLCSSSTRRPARSAC